MLTLLSASNVALACDPDFEEWCNQYQFEYCFCNYYENGTVQCWGCNFDMCYAYGSDGLGPLDLPAVPLLEALDPDATIEVVRGELPRQPPNLAHLAPDLGAPPGQVV